MDFSQFRENGELSDLIVYVGDKEFKLHKFPLFIKSDYFLELIKVHSDSAKEEIRLDDFPGGADTFEEVANYCYNLRVDVARNNVCQLRCAAEVLRMLSRGNLGDASDRVLNDILTSAKLSRDFDSVASLILVCKDLGSVAERAELVDKCLGAIVDCWLLTTQYSRRIPGMDSWTVSPSTKEKVYQMPLAWFIELFTCARDKAVKPAILAELVQGYIDYIVDGKIEGAEVEHGEEVVTISVSSEDTQEEQTNVKVEEKEELKAVDSEDETPTEAKAENETEDQSQVPKEDKTTKDETEGAKDNEEGNDDNKPTIEEQKADKYEDQEEEEKNETQTAQNEQPQEEEKPEEPTKQATQNEAVKETDVDEIPQSTEIAVTLDSLIPEIPESLLLADYLSPHWALRVLRIASANECKCTDVVRRIVSRVAYRLAPEDLIELSDDLVMEIVRESCKEASPAQIEVACALVDTYLAELSKRDRLTVETFNKMVDVVPGEYRFSHDTVFQVLEALLNSESVKLTDEQKQAMLESVDYSRLNESALLRAYQTALVPQHCVTKAALELCAKLRAELSQAHALVKAQERELVKYRVTPAYSASASASPPSYYASSRHSKVSNSRPSKRDSARAAYAMPSAHYASCSLVSPGVPSLASDSELHMVLDSLDKTSEADFPYRSTLDSFSYRSSYRPLFESSGLEGRDLTAQSVPSPRAPYYQKYRY